MIFHTAHGSHFPQNWKENKSMEVTLRVWNCFSLFKSDRGSSFGEQRGLFKWLSWFSISRAMNAAGDLTVLDGDQKEKNEQ